MNDSKLVTKGYLEKYTKSLCNDIIKVVNDVVLNSPTVSSGCEFISQADGSLGLHYKQLNGEIENILTCNKVNNALDIHLLGKTTVESDLHVNGILNALSNTTLKDTTINGILTVNGSTILNGTLEVIGNTTLKGTEINGTLKVTGNTTLKNLVFNNENSFIPTISGDANISNNLKLGQTGKILSGSSNGSTIYNGAITNFNINIGSGSGSKKISCGTGNSSPYISNGVISGFNLQNCTGAGGSEDFVIDAKENPQWDGHNIFERYTLSTQSRAGFDIRDIENAINEKKRIVLQVSEKLTANSNTDRMIELSQFTSLSKDQGDIYVIDGVPLGNLIYVFSESNDFFTQDNSFVIAEAGVYGARCFLYNFNQASNSACDVEIYTAEDDDLTRVTYTDFDRINIIIDNVITQYNSSSQTWPKDAGTAIYNLIENNVFINFHIRNKSFENNKVFDFYTTNYGYNYIKNETSVQYSDQNYIAVNYTKYYDDGGPSVENSYALIPYVISQNNS